MLIDGSGCVRGGSPRRISTPQDSHRSRQIFGPHPNWPSGPVSSRHSRTRARSTPRQTAQATTVQPSSRPLATTTPPADHLKPSGPHAGPDHEDTLRLGVSDTPLQPKAVVLLSGGLDSATVLAIARAEGFECHTLAFDYGQRHRTEIAAAELVAKAIGVASHRVVPLDLRAFGGSALTADIDVPKDRIETLEAQEHERTGRRPVPPPTPHAPHPTPIPITYVPARNLVFLSLGVGLAEVLGARDLFIGVNAVDFSGYPDCRPKFIEAFTKAANLATRAGVEGSPVRVRTPIIEMTKAEIIREGVRLGVDYALTRSCYDPDAEARACGHCDSCILRRRGFAEASVTDPTPYADNRAANG
ncbi:MAG: 7-cyano-7-deazaguanine synthase QueC [Phycisphaerales bacterium]|nr:7-cyano-7-deazaguanine synthase QueC [Phycisphaerales bacterium]